MLKNNIKSIEYINSIKIFLYVFKYFLLWEENVMYQLLTKEANVRESNVFIYDRSNNSN